MLKLLHLLIYGYFHEPCQHQWVEQDYQEMVGHQYNGGTRYFRRYHLKCSKCGIIKRHDA